MVSKLLLSFLTVVIVSFMVFWIADDSVYAWVRILMGLSWGFAMALTLFFHEQNRFILSSSMSLLIFVSHLPFHLFSENSSIASILIVALISIFLFFFYSNKKYFNR